MWRLRPIPAVSVVAAYEPIADISVLPKVWRSVEHMNWRRHITAARLRWVGASALLIFVGLYTLFIIAFSAWQERGVPAAWLNNLHEAIFAFPLAAFFWVGAAAFVFGWWSQRRR